MDPSTKRKIWAIALAVILALVVAIASQFGIDLDIPQVLPAEP